VMFSDDVCDVTAGGGCGNIRHKLTDSAMKTTNPRPKRSRAKKKANLSLALAASRAHKIKK
jgi:hypothetical protein